MDPQIMARQTIGLYRLTFENAFNAVNLLREQNQKMVDMYLEQMTDLPGDGIKAIQDWSHSLDQGIADFKACMDESFKKAEEYFSRPAPGKSR